MGPVRLSIQSGRRIGGIDFHLSRLWRGSAPEAENPEDGPVDHLEDVPRPARNMAGAPMSLQDEVVDD